MALDLGQMLIQLGVDPSGLSQADRSLQIVAQSAERTARTVEKSTKQMGVNWDLLGGKMYTAGIRLSMYITAPLTILSKKSIDMAKDFEWAMTQIIALVGESRDQVSQWSDELFELGAVVGKTPKELAEGLYFVTSSGFAGAEAMDILQQSSKAAAAGLGNVQDIADLVTSAMNAYRSSNLTATRSLDVLIAAVREGKLEAPALAKSMGAVIPIASEMGISFDQVASAMASMSLTGLDAAEAATALRGLLNSLLDPAEQSEQALRQMGTSGAELRYMMGTDLFAALKKVKDLTNIYGEDLVSKVIPNVRALTGFLSLMGDNYENNLRIMQEVYNSTGGLNKAYEDTSETIRQRYNRQLAKHQATMISLGEILKEQLIPMYEWFTNAIHNLVSALDNLNPKMQSMVVRFGIFVAAAGPLLLALSTLAKIIIPNLIFAVGLLTKAFAGLTAVMMINPIVAFASALAVLAGLSIVKFIDSLNAAKKAKMEFDNAMRNSKILELYPDMSGIDDLIERMKEVSTADQLGLNALRSDVTNQIKLKEELLANINRVNGAMLRAEKTLGEEYSDEAKADYARRKKSYEDLLKLFDIYLNQINARQEELTPPPKYFEDPAIDEAFTELEKNLAVVDKMATFMNAMGEEFDVSEEKLKLMQGTLETLATTSIPITDQRLQDLLSSIMSLQGGTDDLTKVMDDLNSELTFLVMKKAVLGDMYDDVDYLTNVLNAYETALDEALRTGEATGEQIQELAESVRFFRQELEATKKTVDTFSQSMNWINFYYDGLTGVSDQMSKLQQEMNAVAQEMERAWMNGEIERAKELQIELRGLKEEYEGLGEKMQATQIMANMVATTLGDLGTAMVEGASGFDSMITNMLSGLKQLATQLLITAIAKTWDKSMESTKNPIAGLALGLVATSALLAMHQKSVQKANAAKMKTGGTVPPGYPNDTYPALLTSGEKVLPPKALAEGTNMHVTFDDIVLDGRKLKIIVDKYNAYKTATT